MTTGRSPAPDPVYTYVKRDYNQGMVGARNGVLRVGTKACKSGRYEGVLRRGSKVLFTCGHPHHNRDLSTQSRGQSARDCVSNMVRATRIPGAAASTRNAILSAPAAYARTWQASTGQVERLKQAAQANLATFEQQLTELTALVGREPVFDYTDHVLLTPPTPAPQACRYCQTLVVPNRWTVRLGWIDFRPAELPSPFARSLPDICSRAPLGRHDVTSEDQER